MGRNCLAMPWNSKLVRCCNNRFELIADCLVMPWNSKLVICCNNKV